VVPHRWYNWALQQQALMLLFAGCSLRRVSAIFALGRHTVRRWWQRLGERSPLVRNSFAKPFRRTRAISRYH